MRSALAKGLSVVGAMMLAAAMMPACAHNDTSLFINGLLSAPARTPTTQCLYQAGAALQLVPSFDVSASDSYVSVLDVRSQLLSRISRDQNRTETAIAVIKGAIVTVTYPDGTSVVPPYTYLTQGTVTATTGVAAQGFVAVALLNQAAVVALRDKLPKRRDRALAVSTVKVFGDTLGGQSIESNEYSIPITLCRGCSMDFSCAGVTPSGGPDCSVIDFTKRDLCRVSCNDGEGPTACQLCVDPVRGFCDGTAE